MPLTVFPNLKQLINHKQLPKKNQRKIIINICQLYSIPSHMKKKSNQKNLLAVIMYNVWNSKIVPIMNVFFSIALYYFSPSTNYPIINYVRR